MSRITLTDGTGRWFSTETAEKFKETSYHDGRNFISNATGSQWEHEILFRTKGGRFILNHYSNWQGTSETYEEISAEDAAIWFSKNGLDPHPACLTEFNELEIK